MTLLLPPPLINGIHHMDWRQLMMLLPAQSVDAVITDPPYGLNIDKWDKPIDIPGFLSEAHRVLKTGGFFAFTIQMPHMVDWLAALKQTPFRYKEHVSWVKRKFTNAATPLCRAHESILIYSKGSASFFETKGAYEDVKLPGYVYGILNIESIDRYIKDLRIKANGGKPSISRKNKTVGHESYHYMRAIDGDRSAERVNFTNVWSFLPDSLKVLDLTESAHATQKPILLMKRLVELVTKSNDVILDPFCGSGTTLVAAQELGRVFIGGDLSAEYVRVAQSRLATPFTVSMFA